jgi:uncharacterized protein
MLEFTWDENKRKLNVRKHGIDFEDAKLAFGIGMFSRLDSRQDYGEDRLIGTGILWGRVIVVVFVERENSIRIISARKATKDEIKTYYEKIRDRLGKIGQDEGF